MILLRKEQEKGLKDEIITICITNAGWMGFVSLIGYAGVFKFKNSVVLAAAMIVLGIFACLLSALIYNWLENLFGNLLTKIVYRNKGIQERCNGFWCAVPVMVFIPSLLANSMLNNPELSPAGELLALLMIDVASFMIVYDVK